jgi:uncharacterized membrane protein
MTMNVAIRTPLLPPAFGFGISIMDAAILAAKT